MFDILISESEQTLSLLLGPYPINPAKHSIFPAGDSTQPLSRPTRPHRSHRLHGSHGHQGIYHCQVSTLHQSHGRKRMHCQRWDRRAQQHKSITANIIMLDADADVSTARAAHCGPFIICKEYPLEVTTSQL